VPRSPMLRVLRLPGTGRLLPPALAARIPDSITATSIVVLVRAVTGSSATAGVAAGAFGIGTAVSAPAAGRALDRFGQRRVLPLLAAAFGCTLTAVALTAGSLAGGSLAGGSLAGGSLAGGSLAVAGLVALAALAGLARPPLEAGLRALWPALVPPALLDTAYALDSAMQELIWIGGPLLLALLLAVGSPRLPLIVCGVLSVAGTFAYASSSRVPREGRARVTAHSPVRSPRLRLLLGMCACYGAAAGVLNLALVAYAAAHGGVAWTGVLVAIWGAGSLVGGAVYGSRHWHTRVEWRATGCLALFGAMVMLLAAAPSLAVLALLMILPGLPLSPWLGSLSASVQQAAPGSAATEAFTWSFAVITLGIAAGNALGGVITRQAAPSAAFLLAGAFAVTGAALGALRLSRHTPRAPVRAPERRLEPGYCGHRGTRGPDQVSGR
jgi:MFS family permease